MTTHKHITADPCNAVVPPEARGKTHIAPVPLVCSIAQRVSHDLIIQASIECVPLVGLELHGLIVSYSIGCSR